VPSLGQSSSGASRLKSTPQPYSLSTQRLQVLNLKRSRVQSCRLVRETSAKRERAVRAGWAIQDGAGTSSLDVR